MTERHLIRSLLIADERNQRSDRPISTRPGKRGRAARVYISTGGRLADGGSDRFSLSTDLAADTSSAEVRDRKRGAEEWKLRSRINQRPVSSDIGVKFSAKVDRLAALCGEKEKTRRRPRQQKGEAFISLHVVCVVGGCRELEVTTLDEATGRSGAEPAPLIACLRRKHAN